MSKKEFKEKSEQIVKQMSLEEKAAFAAGKDFWHIQGIERLGIPMTMVTDGPHGLRKQVLAVDHLGLSDSNPAVCFPAGCALASSFDPELAQIVGSELGAAAQSEDVSVLLGPAMNIKRSPLCGRNFEYYSEDPHVAGAMAAGIISGIQSKNIGACPKHFAANNQEYYRQTSDSVVDEQTLREIYLAGFEEAVKEAHPWSMMCSYNKINGTYASENKELLTDILRDEWGFDGYVMTDWGACDDPVDSVKAGLDLIMPGPSEDSVNRIRAAVEDGQLPEEILDRAVSRTLARVLEYTENHQHDVAYDYEKGHLAAQRAEEESAVLLKNEGRVLPLDASEKVVFIGEFALNPRYQGGGSSHIHPYRVDSAWEAAMDKYSVTWVKGYEKKENTALLDEAVQAAGQADKAVIFAGLPDAWESEGTDRKKMDLPDCQNRLIEAVAAAQPNTVVVLHNGSPVTMPWIDRVRAVLEMYLGGEAVGPAAVRLLYGQVNPSGRLAETFPQRIEDTPSYPFYGAEKNQIIYREERMVGYRFYETMKRPVLFPFGHGLSYTQYKYENLRLDRDHMRDDETVTVSVDVTNVGRHAGKEVVQIYVSPCESEPVRPVRELRAFKKVGLEAGETKTVSVVLGKRAFAEWNTEIHDWYVPEGTYQIHVGISAAEMVLTKNICVKAVHPITHPYTINVTMGELMADPAAASALGELFGTAAAGQETPSTDKFGQKDAALGQETLVAGGSGHKTGGVGSLGQKADENDSSGMEASASASDEEELMSQEAMAATSAAMPLRSMLSFVPGLTLEAVQSLVDQINLARQTGDKN